MNVKEFQDATETNLIDTRPYAIAETLSALTRMNRKNGCCRDYEEQLVDAVFDLKELCSAFASPDYNRTLYMALVDIANRYKLGEITITEE